MNFWCKIGLHRWIYDERKFSFKVNRKCINCNKKQTISQMQLNSQFFFKWITLDKD